MSNELEQRVKHLVAEQLGNEQEISNDSSLDDLGADSLDAVELSMAMEDEFNIELSDDEIKQITTVQSAIDLAKAKQEQ